MPGRVGLGWDGLRLVRVVISVWAIAGWVACGDDDGSKGSGDASTDAAVEAGTRGPTFIPRRDAAVTATDPIQPCDRFNPRCPDGLVCDVLYRVFSGTNAITAYAGCVEPGRERGLGAPCDADFTTQTPYRTEGLRDIVFRDPCGPNLFCAPDPKVRGGTSCQPACASGNFDGESPSLCEDTKSFCIGPRAFQEYCRPSDGCDVAAQTGCPAGLSCYLRPTDDGKGFLSLCFPPADPTVADFKACDAYNACRPGSSCNGPISLAISEWQLSDYVCRPACSADGSTIRDDSDAGQDDGGTAPAPAPAPGCGQGKKCRPYAGTGLNLAGIENPPYGQCE